jgi:predicted aspartyl protease
MITTRRQLIAAGAAFAALPGAARAQELRTPLFMSQKKIHVNTRINGATVMGIVDSGSAFHAMDYRMADRLNIPGNGRPVGSRGIAGLLRGNYSPPVNLIVAGQSMVERVVVLDLSDFSQRLGEPVDLLLGRPMFDEFVVDIDFVAGNFALRDRETFTPPVRATEVLLRTQSGLLTAPVQLPGGSVYATVDTGASTPLLISPRPARSVGVLDTPWISTTRIGGLSGVNEGQIASTPTLGFAGSTFEDVPVRIASRSIGTDANLGMELLSQFHLWIDFAGRRMWAIPNGDRLPFSRDLLGVFGEVDGSTLRILHIAQGSPAETAGLREGDIILQINGRPAFEANRQLIDAGAGQELIFTLASGDERRAVLTRYY